MAAGVSNFCSSYTPAPGLDNEIDTSQEDFFVRYRAWEAAARNKNKALLDDPGDMLLYFGNPSRSEEALNKGDAGSNAGEVRSAHCLAFNRFVQVFKESLDTYSDADLASYGHSASVRSGLATIVPALFSIALHKMSSTRTLSPAETCVMNGSVFLKTNLKPSSIGTGTEDNRLYAIPGYIAFAWQHPLDDGFWTTIDGIVEDAFQQSGSRLVNLSGAAQLRLKGAGDTIGPIVVAPGWIVCGSGG